MAARRTRRRERWTRPKLEATARGQWRAGLEVASVPPAWACTWTRWLGGQRTGQKWMRMPLCYQWKTRMIWSLLPSRIRLSAACLLLGTRKLPFLRRRCHFERNNLRARSWRLERVPSSAILQQCTQRAHGLLTSTARPQLHLLGVSPQGQRHPPRRRLQQRWRRRRRISPSQLVKAWPMLVPVHRRQPTLLLMAREVPKQSPPLCLCASRQWRRLKRRPRMPLSRTAYPSARKRPSQPRLRTKTILGSTCAKPRHPPSFPRWSRRRVLFLLHSRLPQQLRREKLRLLTAMLLRRPRWLRSSSMQ
mmetsp:Transcript_8209/g.15569  ORF Transcript_8209/g.15569 Transcript_8209/m.15569 type:complete len:305 (+) Transcript_8209:283-1197(+)